MDRIVSDQLEQSQAMNKLLLEMVKTQKAHTQSMIRLFIIVIVCYTILLLGMVGGFFWYESQFEVTEQVVTEETVTQEVSGQDSEINNIEGNMYKDSAVHNEGGEE